MAQRIFPFGAELLNSHPEQYTKVGLYMLVTCSGDSVQTICFRHLVEFKGSKGDVHR